MWGGWIHRGAENNSKMDGQNGKDTVDTFRSSVNTHNGSIVEDKKKKILSMQLGLNNMQKKKKKETHQHIMPVQYCILPIYKCILILKLTFSCIYNMTATYNILF